MICMSAARQARANWIYAHKQDEFDIVTRRLMKVPSQYIPGHLYDVRMSNGHAVSGSCPDYMYNHPVNGCKHMLAANKYYRLKL